MRLKTSLAVLLALGLLVGAGCGDDDTTSSTTTTTEDTGASGASGASGESGSAGVLPADFAAQADKICADADKELDAAAAQLGSDPQGAALSKYVNDTFVPNVQGQIDAIKALPAPSEGADELDQFLSDAESTVDDIASNPEALTSGDPFAKVSQEATALGLKECAS